MRNKPSAADREQKRQCDAWLYPVGTPVEVTKDKGEKVRTKTRSMPWMLGASCTTHGHTAVILVEGITGGYLLSRVRPLRQEELDREVA